MQKMRRYYQFQNGVKGIAILAVERDLNVERYFCEECLKKIMDIFYKRYYKFQKALKSNYNIYK